MALKNPRTVDDSVGGTTTVRIPMGLAERIDRLLDSPHAQHVSRNDFARDAIRALLENEEARIRALAETAED